jgi:UDP-N-acetyl-D-galactosamine dehydrogenase
VILSGRRINDNMGVFISNKVIKLLIKKGHKVAGAKALILGITFKENCPDIRNTKVVDIYNELKQVGVAVDVYDPWASPAQVKADYNISLIKSIEDTYDAIILAVAHNEFNEIDFSKLIKDNNSVIYDTKSVLPRDIVDGRL